MARDEGHASFRPALDTTKAREASPETFCDGLMERGDAKLAAPVRVAIRTKS